MVVEFTSLDLLHECLGGLLVIADAVLVPCLHLVVRLRVIVHASQDDVLDVPELVSSLMLAPVEEANAIRIWVE